MRLLLAVAALLVLAAPAAAAPPRCPDGRVAARGPAGRIVVTRPHRVTVVHLCRPDGRRVYALTVGANPVRLADVGRRYASFAAGAYVWSWDLDGGRRRLRALARPDAMVMTAGGWLAWVQDGAVVARDADGLRTLDAGPVEPASLTRGGATVYWGPAGARRSAHLRVGPEPLVATPACRGKRGEEVATTPAGRIVQTFGPDDDFYGPASTLHLCRGALEAGDESFGEGTYVEVGQVTSTERELAFSTYTTSSQCTKYLGDAPECHSASIRSYDMVAGERRAQVDTEARQLAVSADGWLAWISPGSEAAVLARVAGETRTLDPGPADDGSLTVSGTTAAWTHGGEPRSADLR